MDRRWLLGLVQWTLFLMKFLKDREEVEIEEWRDMDEIKERLIKKKI